VKKRVSKKYVFTGKFWPKMTKKCPDKF